MRQCSRSLFSTILLLLVLGGCAAPSEINAPNVHTVEPGLLVRGGQPDAAEFREIRDTYGIRTVVNLNDDTAESEAAIVRDLGMAYVALPSNAFDPQPEKLLTFLQVVEEHADVGPVFVHCRQGMDRAGTAVAAWRVVCCGWDAERALDELYEHQAAFNTLVFAGVIPPFVRSIVEHRDTWREALGLEGESASAAAPPRAW